MPSSEPSPPPPGSHPPRLVLFVHGSRDPRWRRPFEALRESAAARLGAGRVRLAFMEFSEPTLLDVAAEAIRDGVGEIRLLPLFMAGGAHVDRDIPEQVRAVLERHPGLGVAVLPPIGEDPRFAELVLRLAVEAAG